MVKFKNGDSVIKIEHNEIRKGVIRKMCFDAEPVIALVEFDDGLYEKTLIDNLAPAPIFDHDVEVTPQEDKVEPIEKTEVTITQDEFRHIAVKLAVEKSEGDFKLGMLLSLFSADIASALFKVDSE